MGIGNVSLLNLGKVPDIYMLLKGVRIIIETKEVGQRVELDEQINQRLDRNMCEIIIGIEYPTSFVKGALTPPTPKEIRKSLMTKKVTVHAYKHGAVSKKPIFENKSIVIPELPEILVMVAGESLKDNELDQAIEKVRDSIESFVASLASLDTDGSISKLIMEELEIGEESE